MLQGCKRRQETLPRGQAPQTNSAQQYGLHGCFHDFGMLAHAHVVIATPDSHVSSLVIRHVGVGVVVGVGKHPGLTGHHAKLAVRVVPAFVLDFAVEECLVI